MPKPKSRRKAIRKPRVPAPPPVAAPPEWQDAVRQGEENARWVLERRRARAARRRVRRRGGAGLLVAEGDSWFDYPFFDVLEELEEVYGYSVESVAHKGDTVEEMAYDRNQLDKLARKLEQIKKDGRTPKAVLLSGGGNDIAGDEFPVLLNHKRSSLPTLSESIVTGLLDERLRAAVISLASGVTELCRATFGRPLPMLIHGYDYPVPDGRGYLGGFWILPGPWLAPGFRNKGYDDEHLRERCDVMVTLIDRFNRVLSGIAGGPQLEHLRYVNLRGTLSREPAAPAYKDYRQWWNDELHPTEKGFTRIAGVFDSALRGA
jgi:hypothetical protein